MIARFVPLLLLCSAAMADDWKHAELHRFKAAEANQGVAVDGQHFYAITNHAIGKYRKDTGERVAAWNGIARDKITHLNQGVVLDGKLWCAHSNFPEMPEQSSVEIWDTETLQHTGEHRFEKPPGSLTWVDRRNGEWFACFAHYKSTSDPALSRVMKFDANWKPGEEPMSHLYKNNRDGTFTDVTAKAGVAHSGWGQGVCVGDYDNDGWDDLFVTYYGKNVLYHNDGGGHFSRFELCFFVFTSQD